MNKKYPECEGCMMEVDMGDCILQRWRQTKNCPCSSCIVKITCRTHEQICNSYSEYYSKIRSDIDHDKM